MKQKSTKLFELTEDAFRELADDSGGFCIACRGEAYGVEPDARRYTCEGCGEPQVYGAEELLLMGHIAIVSEEEDAES